MSKSRSQIERQFDLARNQPQMPDDMRLRVIKRIQQTPDSTRAEAKGGATARLGHRLRGPITGMAGLAGVAIVTFFLVEGMPSLRRNSILPPSTMGVAPLTDVATSVQLVTKSDDSKPYNVEYPQIYGMQNLSIQKRVNQTLRTMAMKPSGLASIQKQYGKTDPIASIDSNYMISYQRGNLMDFVFTSELVPKFTADGGVTVVHSAIFNLASGRRYSMSDLFQDHSPYLHELSSLVRKNDPQGLLGHGFPYPIVKPTDTFLVTHRGVAIVFQQDEWTAHVDGTPEFTIPFGQLNALIDKKGSFWKALQAAKATKNAPVLEHDVTFMNKHGYDFAPDTNDVPSLGMYQAIQHSPLSKQPIYALVGIAKKSQSPTKVFFFEGEKFIGVAASGTGNTVQGVYPGAGGSLVVNVVGSNFVNGRLESYYMPYRFDGKRMVSGKKSSHP